MNRKWHSLEETGGRGPRLAACSRTPAWAFSSGNRLAKIPSELRAERDRLATQAKLLKADVARGEKIRASLPQVGKDCDSFYQQSFLDPITGYSDIETDLDAIAAKANVKTTGFTFKQKEVKDRGVTEISIGTSVDADYPARHRLHQRPGALEIFLFAG